MRAASKVATPVVAGVAVVVAKFGSLFEMSSALFIRAPPPKNPDLFLLLAHASRLQYNTLTVFMSRYVCAYPELAAPSVQPLYLGLADSQRKYPHSFLGTCFHGEMDGRMGAKAAIRLIRLSCQFFRALFRLLFCLSSILALLFFRFFFFFLLLGFARLCFSFHFLFGLATLRT